MTTGDFRSEAHARKYGKVAIIFATALLVTALGLLAIGVWLKSDNMPYWGVLIMSVFATGESRRARSWINGRQTQPLEERP